MVKKMFFTIALFAIYQCVAQQKESFTGAGLLKVGLGFNQSFMLQHRSNNVYLGGHLEYFTSPNLSFRGDCFAYLDTRRKLPVIKQNTVVLFGALLHLPKGKNDFYGGIQPGFSLTKPAVSSLGDQSYPLRFLPVLNLTLGYSLYFSRFCHFFIGVNYMVARYRGAETGSIKLDEFMISGGLGFHIKTKNKSR
ncbi:MAG TPA: hypothetical protein PKW80_11400 [Bacteroidales bacterium]|nr:hypothetical protein [Bacteroidales bacterium]